MSKTIYWLASYPKSGNTWLRAFIANLRCENRQGVDINALDDTANLVYGRAWLDNLLGFESGLLTYDEIDQLTPTILKEYAQGRTQLEYRKTHHAFRHLPDGQPLLPIEVTAGAVYLVRNPLDVAVSFSHHRSCSIDEAIRQMADPELALAGYRDSLIHPLREKMLDWSGHVAGWLDAGGSDTLVVHYEAMVGTPLSTFTRICRFLHLPDDTPSVQRALESSSLKNLQQQEAARGFREKAQGQAQFFRKGVAGDWQQTLTPAQIERIVADHGPMMRRLGYLDVEGRPLVMPAQEPAP